MCSFRPYAGLGQTAKLFLEYIGWSAELRGLINAGTFFKFESPTTGGPA